ncbi:MAG: DUF721 domain-containing protein [Bacteroidaceae bacterium]|nr:DUF721 domain-containing protein [Bacteroidaceae bacterium]
MKRRKALPIGDILRQYLREEGLESPLQQQRLLTAWPEVVGPLGARYTENLFIKNQALFVHVTSPAFRQELNMAKAILIRNLNAKAGAQVITNIIFK